MLGQRQSRDVLVLRAVRRAQDSHDINDGTDVWAVIAASRGGCRTELRQQVRGSAGRECCYHVLAVRVIED